MELLQLRYFLTVARLLNISKAAEQHMIPQPAMSQTISRLEKELGKPLFDRYKNKLSLTRDGKAFFEAVSASLSELDAGVQQLDRDDTALQGELKLLVRQHRGTMVDCIVAFRKRYPNVSFRTFYAQNANESQDYDLCIASAPPGEEYSNSRCLITEKLQLLVAASHPIAVRKSVAFEDLRQESFALLDKDNSLWHHTEHLCHRAGFAPKISMLCGDLHCMIKYVATGMAVTLGPVVSWQGLKNDDVVFVPIVPEQTRSTYVFWNDRRANSRLQQTFLEFMVEYFATLQ